MTRVAPDWLDSPTTVAPPLLGWSLQCGLIDGQVSWVLREEDQGGIYLLTGVENPSAGDLIRWITSLAGMATAEELVAGAVKELPNLIVATGS